MPRKPISFELDFMIKDIFPRFTVKQFDDVSFNIKPLNQGLEYDTSNMTGKIYVGVNNDMFMQTTDITVSSDNINVLLDKNMLQKNGRAYAEIELTDEDGTITSSSFIFDIDPKIGEGGMIPGEYEGFVEKYERLISEFKAQINSNISNSNDLVDKAIKNCNTSIDNKLNTVDTRLNTKVSEVDNKLNTVDNRVDAKISEVDAKLSTVDSRLNSKVLEVDTKLDTVDGLITAKVSDFEKRFNRLTSSQQQDAEVIEAREGEVSLKARLDRDIEKANNLEESVASEVVTESSFTTIENTSNGYFSDIKLEGKTLILNADNEVVDAGTEGATLKSVGQDVDEISVLSCNENLFNVDDVVSNDPYFYKCNEYIQYTASSSVTILKKDFEYNAIYTFTFKASSNRSGNTVNINFLCEYTDGTIEVFTIRNIIPNTVNTGTFTSTRGKTIKSLKNANNAGELITLYLYGTSITKGEQSKPYKPFKQDKKRILYYNTETDTWGKPVLRQFDSIEKHSDNKYYYHVRSEEVPYTEGDETKADHITDMTTTVKKLSTEKVYECTNLDLITYSGETNLVTRSGVLNPKVTLKVKKGIGNVVTMLQNKVAMLEDLVNKLIQK